MNWGGSGCSESRTGLDFILNVFTHYNFDQSKSSNNNASGSLLCLKVLEEIFSSPEPKAHW